MNNSEAQKAREYEQLTSFLDNARILTYDSIVPLTDGQDPPDFILFNGNKRVGIELTELFIKQVSGRYTLKELEAFQDGILQQVWRNLESVALPCLTVEVEVHFAKPPNSQVGYESNKIIKPLCELITNCVKDWTSVEHKYEYVKAYHIPGIQGVFIRSGMSMGIQWLDSNRLKRASLHWVRREPLDEVLEAIRRKEQRLHNYREDYDAVYLLLIGNRHTGSQAFELSNEFVQSTMLGTKFDRVFYYDVFHKRGVELRV